MASPSSQPEQPHSPYKNPYYLSPSDMPGTSLVTEPLKDDSNYELWSRQMRNQLSIKNKWGYIDGSFPRPKTDTEKQMLWDQSHSALVSWFEKSVHKSLVMYVSCKADVKVVWEAFKARFGSTIGTQRYQLRQKQFENKMTGTSVSEYYSNISDLWVEIATVEAPIRCSCDNCTCRVNERLEERTDEHNAMDFLLGLPESFSNYRTNILSKETLPNVDKAFNLAKEDEHQRRKDNVAGNSALDSVVLAVSSPPAHGYSSTSSGTKLDSKGRTICSHCHKLGHTAQKCYRLVEFLPGWTPKGKGKQVAPAGTAFQLSGEGGERKAVSESAFPTGFPNTGTGFPFPPGSGPGPTIPQVFYPGAQGPVPISYIPSPFGPGQQGAGQNFTGYYGLQPGYSQGGQMQDQGTLGQNSPNGSTPFASFVRQPMGQMTANSPLSLDQLLQMLSALNIIPPPAPLGNYEGP